jgi:hypothetical protein
MRRQFVTPTLRPSPECGAALRNNRGSVAAPPEPSRVAAVHCRPSLGDCRPWLLTSRLPAAYGYRRAGGSTISPPDSRSAGSLVPPTESRNGPALRPPSARPLQRTCQPSGKGGLSSRPWLRQGAERCHSSLWLRCRSHVDLPLALSRSAGERSLVAVSAPAAAVPVQPMPTVTAVVPLSDTSPGGRHPLVVEGPAHLAASTRILQSGLAPEAPSCRPALLLRAVVQRVAVAAGVAGRVHRSHGRGLGVSVHLPRDVSDTALPLPALSALYRRMPGRRARGWKPAGHSAADATQRTLQLALPDQSGRDRAHRRQPGQRSA